MRGPINTRRGFEHIDPELLARDTLEFVKVRSETGREGEGSRFLAALLERGGLGVTLDEVEPDRPNVCALAKGSPARARWRLGDRARR